MSVSYWNDKGHKKEALSVDVIVIGAGIAGLSTAFWLAKEDPDLRVAIVEKYEVGSGATGRNAGFMTCGSVEHFNRLVGKHGEEEALEIWRFSEENLRLLKSHIITPCSAELDFHEKGSFSLASSKNEFDELKESAALMGRLGIKVEVVEQQEILSRLGAEGFVGGIKYGLDADIHPLKLLNAIKQETLKLSENIRYYENNEVYEIGTIGDEKFVRTNKKMLKAQMVIFATNGYSALLNNYFSDKIFATRGQILITEPVPLFMEGPVYANFVLDYFRQLPTGELIIGGFRQLQKDVEKGYSDEVSDVIQKALHDFLEKHIPAVRGKKITHRWSGIMGFSIDGQPLIGSLPTDPQLFFLGGFTAHGLGLAFNSGKKLVDLLFDRPIPPFLSAKRFS